MTPSSEPSRFGLRELLCEQLRDLYDAGTQYQLCLANVIDAVVSPKLGELMEGILIDVEDGISGLAEACEILGVPPRGIRCEAMAGLVREGKGSTWEDSATRDAAIIANAQRVVHYEIAGYGTAAEFARCLGLSGVAAILKRLLRQSFENDRHLSRAATGGWFATGINRESAENIGNAS